MAAAASAVLDQHLVQVALQREDLLLTAEEEAALVRLIVEERPSRSSNPASYTASHIIPGCGDPYPECGTVKFIQRTLDGCTPHITAAACPARYAGPGGHPGQRPGPRSLSAGSWPPWMQSVTAATGSCGTGYFPRPRSGRARLPWRATWTCCMSGFGPPCGPRVCMRLQVSCIFSGGWAAPAGRGPRSRPQRSGWR